MNRKLVAIDFDKTLSTEAGRPIQANIDLAQYMFDEGHIVVIYTARPRVDLPLVQSWLIENNVRHDMIVTDKLRYDVLVDDRTVSFDQRNPEPSSVVIQKCQKVMEAK